MQSGNEEIMKIDHRQQELLRKFYQEETTWCPEHVGYQLVTAIMIGISMLLGVIPYQAWELSRNISTVFIWSMLYLTGAVYYVLKFMSYTEGRKTKSVFDILRYLPVSHRQVQIFIMRKAIRLYGRLTVVTICCQTVFALSFMHTFSVVNIILPVGVNLLLPMVYVWLITLFGWR